MSTFKVSPVTRQVTSFTPAMLQELSNYAGATSTFYETVFVWEYIDDKRKRFSGEADSFESAQRAAMEHGWVGPEATYIDRQGQVHTGMDLPMGYVEYINKYLPPLLKDESA